MKKPKLVTNEVYHIYNRGVEKRNIFLNDKDYFRFIHDVFEFNDIAPTMNLNFHFQSNYTILRNPQKPRKLLVEILCFCLMPNHYHILLRQKVDGGITDFMRKLGTGYANYFNQKYQRVGPLCQGKFKAVHVTEESYLLYLPHYIHLNPLDLFMPEWRNQKISDVDRALRFLASYRWSSYMDYIGKKNFPSLIQRNFLSQIYRSPTSIVNYKKEMTEWLQKLDFTSIQGVTME